MSSRVVRVSESVLRDLREMAERSNQTQQAILEEAIEELKRKRFFDQMDAAFTRLKANPGEWEEYEDERNLWEGTLKDGLDKE